MRKILSPILACLLLLVSLSGCFLLPDQEEPEYLYDWSDPVYETSASPFVPNAIGCSATLVYDADIYFSANSTNNILDVLPAGETVLVSAFTHYDSTTLACIGNGWINIECLLFSGYGISGAIPVTVKGQGLRYRTGPGTDYESMGEFDRGKQVPVVRLYNSEPDGIPWAMLGNGYWVCAEYLQFPENTVVIPGTNAPEIPSTQNPGTSTTPGATPTTPQSQKPSGGSIQQTPNNTPIVNTWEHYNAQAFLTSGTLNDNSITFYGDGTFMTSEGGGYGCYSLQNGTFQSGKGGAGEGGIFTYDGNTLILQFTYLWYAGVFEPFDAPRTETYTASISGDYLTFNGQTYRNYSTMQISNNHDDLPRLYMAGATAPYVKSGYVGTWQTADGTTLTLASDGTFTETDQNGNVYTGDYLVVSNYIYLSRTTKNGSTFYFYVYGMVTLKENSFTIETWDIMFGPASTVIEFTKVVE